MNEEDKPAEEPVEGDAKAEDPKPEGEKGPDAPSQNSTKLIDAANTAAERMEKATKRMEAATSKQEALNVEKTLGGEAEAGQGNKEETPEEYAARVMNNDIETSTGS